MLKKLMIAAFTAALSLAAAPTASAISQGELINTDSASCTAGYIDHARGTMLTAAHCVTHVGQAVYDANFVEIGRVESMGRTAAYNWGMNDWATVRLHPGHVGGNGVTGNAKSQVRLGDTVCVHSQRGGGRITCAPVVWDTGTSLILAPIDPTATFPGDSGGAAFSPNKGAVGLVSGDFMLGKIVTRHPDIAPAPSFGSSF